MQSAHRTSSGFILALSTPTPLRNPSQPVMISARLGTQIGFGAIARVKTVPSPTSESSAGV